MSIVQSIILSQGWRRALIAALAGAFGALAMAPFDIWPAMIIPMTLAVWLLDGAASGETRFSMGSLRAAALIGWFWGFGYFVAGLWWLGAAFLVEADKFAALMPLGVIGLPAALAFFPCFGFVLARLLWSAGWARIFALGVGLGASEALRATILTGFPWNAPGMALGGTLLLAQSASIFGLFGLNLLAIILFGAPALMIEPKTRRLAVLLPVLGLAALALYGSVRLSLTPTEWVKGVKLRIMQPNIPLDDHFRPENRMAILQKYLSLSDRAKSAQSGGINDVTHLIWPESPFPAVLSRDAEMLSAIGQFLPAQTTLITGAVRMEQSPAEPQPHYFNAMQVLASGGSIIASYDKVHLVPFGEYLPLESSLRALGLTQFVQMPGGFEAGTWNKPLKIPNLPLAVPAICYEAIFPSEIIANGPRAELIINITNDTWFGRTPGPYQHLALARLTALSTGLPLVRAANSGVSAVIDPAGRILDSLPLNVADVLDSPLPKALGQTIFARFGAYPAALLYFLCLLVALNGRRQKN